MDMIICGNCRQEFPIDKFSLFIQHKIFCCKALHLSREPQVTANCKPSYNHSHNHSQLNRDAHFDRPSNPSLSLCTLAQAASTVSPSRTDSAENSQCLKEIGTQTPLCARRLLPSRVINYFCRCNSASQRNKQVTPHTAEPQPLLSNSLEFSPNETHESVSKRKRPNETEDEPTQTAPIIPDVISACGCASSCDTQTPQPVHTSAPVGCCARTSNGNAAQSPRNAQVGAGCCSGESNSNGCCAPNQSNVFCAPNQSNSNTSARVRAPSVASVSTRGTSSLNVVYLGSGATSKTSASNGGAKCPCANGASCASRARPLQLPAGGDGDSDDSSADADADSDADVDVDAGADSDTDAVGHVDADADSKRSPPAREREREREHTHERRAASIISSSSAHQSRRSHVFKRYRRPQILICQCGSASTPVTQQVASSASASANANEAQAFHDANSPAVPISAAASLSAPNRAATPKTPNPPTTVTPRAGSAHTSFVIPLTPHAPSSAPPAPPAPSAPALTARALSHSAHAAQSVASGALDVDVVAPAAPSQKAVAGVGVGVGAGGGTTVEATIGGVDRTIHITLNTAGSCCPPGGSGGCCGSMRERELNGHEGAEAKPSTSAKVRESRECQTEEGLEWPGELDLGLLDQIDPSALLGSGSGLAIDPLQLAALYSTAAGVWSDTASASSSALPPALESYSAALGRPAAPALGAASAFESNMDSYEPVDQTSSYLNPVVAGLVSGNGFAPQFLSHSAPVDPLWSSEQSSTAALQHWSSAAYLSALPAAASSSASASALAAAGSAAGTALGAVANAVRASSRAPSTSTHSASIPAHPPVFLALQQQPPGQAQLLPSYVTLNTSTPSPAIVPVSPAPPTSTPTQQAAFSAVEERERESGFGRAATATPEGRASCGQARDRDRGGEAGAAAGGELEYIDEETGTRMFVCAECGQRFKQRIHLQKHSSKHTGYKPYQCPEAGCTYATVEKAHLVVHMRNHTGEKPFHCPHCEYAAKQASVLRSHILRRHMAAAAAASASALGCSDTASARASAPTSASASSQPAASIGRLSTSTSTTAASVGSALSSSQLT